MATPPETVDDAADARRQRRKHAGLFDSSPTGYLVVDGAGAIHEANLTAAGLLGLSPDGLTGRRVADFIHQDYRDRFQLRYLRCLEENRPAHFHALMVGPDGRPFHAYLNMRGHLSEDGRGRQVRLALGDFSEQLQMARDLSLSHQCLRIAFEARAADAMLKDFASAIKSYMACDAVGVRLLSEGGRLPYAACEGFSRPFCEQENPLAVKNGCSACIDVIRGRTDPGRSFFTPDGSFYTNAFSGLLAELEVPEFGAGDNACIAAGYESVAVIPLRSETRIVGLIHAADRRENWVPLGVVRQLELAALRMGMSIQRFAAQETLDRKLRDIDFLSSRLLKVQEDEQRRIAVELHDQTGQNLNVLKLQLAAIHNQLRRDQPALKETCVRAQGLVGNIIEDVRRISYGLSPAALDALGLGAAIREMAAEFRDYAGIPVEADVDAVDLVVRRSVRIVLYRIFQEAMTNISKHAGAGAVRLSARRKNSRVKVVIEDDGCGFDIQRLSGPGKRNRGLGLDAIRLRARMIGADLAIDSRPGRGTRIELSVPISPGRVRDE